MVYIQRCFSPLQVFNVSRYTVPLNEVSLLVSQRRGANQEPAIFPVSPPQAHFFLVRFPDRHLHEPPFYDSWNVFRMNWARRIFDILLQRKAGIVHPTLIEEINDAVRPKAPGHRGDCVDDKPIAIFASAQCIFSLLALCNLRSQFFIRRRKLSGSLKDSLLQPFIKSSYFGLGLY